MPLSYVPSSVANDSKRWSLSSLGTSKNRFGAITHERLYFLMCETFIGPTNMMCLISAMGRGVPSMPKSTRWGVSYSRQRNYRMAGTSSALTLRRSAGVFREVPQLPQPFPGCTSEESASCTASWLSIWEEGLRHIRLNRSSWSRTIRTYNQKRTPLHQGKRSITLAPCHTFESARFSSSLRTSRVVRERPILTAEEIQQMLAFIEVEARPSYCNPYAHICGHRVDALLDRVQPGCPVRMCAYRGHFVLGNRAIPRPVEIRLYSRWPWNEDSRRFLRHLLRHLTACYGQAVPGIPSVQAYEFPDVVDRNSRVVRWDISRGTR